MEGREIVAFGAALIAGVLAYSKLIADKESKISDFRKDWINSFRESLSEMLGEAYTISGRIRIRVKHAEAVKAAAKDCASPVESTAEASAVVLEQVDSQDVIPGEKVDRAEVPAKVEAVPLVAGAGTAAAFEETETGVETEDQEVESADDDPIKPAAKPGAGLLSEKQVLDLEKDLTDHWHCLRKAHRAILLHMNFAETASGSSEFKVDQVGKDKAAGVWARLVGSARVKNDEVAFGSYDAKQSRAVSSAAVMLVDQLEQLVEKLLGEYDEVGKEERYEEIKQAISNATLLGNLVLKPEWNRIKDGEPKFNDVLRNLKWLAKIGMALLLFFAFFPRKTGEVGVAQKLIIDVNHQPETSLSCPEMLQLRDAWRGTGPISPNLPWCPPPRK